MTQDSSIHAGNITADHSNVAVGDQINQSLNVVRGSNAPDELKARLEELHSQVEQLATKLPAEQAKEVAQDLTTLTEEAVKESPRRKWYELSATGLMEAANTVADMAAPITTAVKAVLALLA